MSDERPPLEIAIPQLAEEVRLFRVETERENAKRDKRIHLSRVLIGVAIAAALLGIVAGVAGIAAANTAKDNQEKAEADRAERSFGSCVQFNVKQLADRDVLKASILTLAPEAQGDPDKLNAEQRAVYDAYAKTVDDRLPFRTCTTEGIEQFLEHPPADPGASPTTTFDDCADEATEGNVTTDPESAAQIGC